MFLPRYSLRWFFYLIVAVALLSVIIGQGVQGSKWALAVVCGVASLGVTWGVMIAFYAMARLSAAILLPAESAGRQEPYYPAPAVPRPSASESTQADPEEAAEPENKQETADK